MNKIRVLFLCTENACRSQMAEGYLRHLGAAQFEVFSAGIKPTKVNSLTIKVMREVGIDVSSQKSKSVKEVMDKSFDYVITVCDSARQSCPVFPGNFKKIHWELEDPARAQGAEKEKLLIFREVRNQIKENIVRFINLAQSKIIKI
jgi:arsenate reductase